MIKLYLKNNSLENTNADYYIEDYCFSFTFICFDKILIICGLSDKRCFH